ncbi:MAG: hypothetical protein JWO41_414 [Candidatus Saccharibacteria bacterium]|nr:hypothetical protein [Candidatus Saccharibacteria bacterium]
MYSLLVLGIIPGTDIQISFQLWLDCATVLAVVVLASHYIRTHRLAISEAIRTRSPLHAAQLHTRLS